jgi:hypothetical protein
MADGLRVAAPFTDRVVVKGLDISGAGGLAGIVFLSGASLVVEDSSVRGFLNGIEAHPASAATLAVHATAIVGWGTGIAIVDPTATISVTLDRVRVERGQKGVNVLANGSVALRGSVVTITSDGVLAAAPSAGALGVLIDRTLFDTNYMGVSAHGAGTVDMTVRGSTFTKNSTALSAGAAVVRLDRNVISGNTVGISAFAPETALSRGNNTVEGNVSDGAPTGAISGK